MSNSLCFSTFCILFCILISFFFSVVFRIIYLSPYVGGIIRGPYSVKINKTGVGIPTNPVVNQPIMSGQRVAKPEKLMDITIPYALRDAYEVIKSVSVNNTVMTSFTDYGYLKHFYTFYNLSHLEQYPNFYVTTIDEEAYNDVRQRGIPAILYRVMNVDSTSLHRDAIITSKTFHKKVLNKLGYLKQLMQLGFVVLYMDCDLLLFRDPWPILSQYSANEADIVSQKDESLNSGFMLLFPTRLTKLLIEEGERYMLRENELDQESLVYVSHRFPHLRLILLPTDLFSNGRIFFTRHQFFWDSIQPSEIMMHNNYIVGSSNKIYRWREMRFYEEDTDGYYSSPTRQYLMIDANATRLNNTLYLHQAAVLSRILNRTFLLPTFPCPATIPLDKCNLCRDDVECFKRFRKLIQEDFRDYVGRE